VKEAVKLTVVFCVRLEDFTMTTKIVMMFSWFGINFQCFWDCHCLQHRRLMNSWLCSQRCWWTEKLLWISYGWGWDV